MTTPLVIAVDCSTTAAKAIVVDARGRLVGAGAQALDTRSPAPHWFEQQAPQWWTATDLAVRQALDEIPDRSAVAAICVTHQRETFACLDADEKPLRPAILWMDGRADVEVRRYGTDRVELLSGKPADITPGLYKLLWLRDREPDTMARCHRVADVHSYLVHAMTGHWTSSLASTDPLALIDQATGDYSPELLELAGLRREQLPDLVPTGTPLGPLLTDVADRWGVRRDVVVVAGTGDGQAAGVGLAVTDPGAAYLVLGTAVVIGSETPSYLPSRAYRSMVSAMPGQTTVETFSASGTYLPTWFREEFGDPDLAGAPDPQLERAAAALPVGSERLLTLPYWNSAQTPHWDTQASGLTVGWRGCHTRAHFYRSLLEGIAFELRLQLDGLEAARGERVDVLRAMGGGARSALWTQILADVFGRPLEVCASGEVSALGAAAIALTAIGEYATLPEAAAAVAQIDAVVEPRDPAVTEYAALRSIYERMYTETRSLLHALHDLPQHHDTQGVMR
ncbi:xylulose kinase [Mycobacterium sp. PS03-16]|uniref:xylulokinase n=1 Tax=Mycobacterium sp. PS03-16 TaxID=2559611 RepID=UPI0010736481|nr:FGGY family carbohydrate kinase [Mycobacterium sp. PS03-16]TFV59449.1 xylulose kinase [Mycobacterium sp. PS03-16]